jgi:hypothetical protein
MVNDTFYISLSYFKAHYRLEKDRHSEKKNKHKLEVKLGVA